MPGWAATVQKSPSGAVRQITWTGGPLTGTNKVQLPFKLGPVPGTVATMPLKALQTYENGDVVRWIDETPPGGAEPEHPTPVLYVKGSPPPDTPETKPATKSSDRGMSTAVIVAIVVGVLLVLALLGFLLSRSRRHMRSSSD